MAEAPNLARLHAKLWGKNLANERGESQQPITPSELGDEHRTSSISRSRVSNYLLHQDRTHLHEATKVSALQCSWPLTLSNGIIHTSSIPIGLDPQNGYPNDEHSDKW